MTLPQHVEQAAAGLEEAHARVAEVRDKEPTTENLREWLDALTETCTALSEIEAFNNESLHEKLQILASHTGFEDLV